MPVTARNASDREVVLRCQESAAGVVQRRLFTALAELAEVDRMQVRMFFDHEIGLFVFAVTSEAAPAAASRRNSRGAPAEETAPAQKPPDPAAGQTAAGAPIPPSMPGPERHATRLEDFDTAVSVARNAIPDDVYQRTIARHGANPGKLGMGLDPAGQRLMVDELRGLAKAGKP